MSSIVQGYEYDIFISYRQKDNKHNGWVTEFVDNLKGELESTFKEEISVYFDINPHDGLLETHDVNASLKDKLKCLVFIPIISRTYCDPNSFAWEHEFKAFVEQASQDQFGLKIKVPNGNIASRVLPIQIHEITADDKTHIERELGGILRSIEFIYKEPGVNRPLRGNEDHPDNNLNKTFYRNQVNKVANAIDEIISSLKNVQAIQVNEKTLHSESLEEIPKEEKLPSRMKPVIKKNHRLLAGVLITAILVITAVLVYPKLSQRNTLEKLRSSRERISIAVMPFQNMTNDTIWNIWQKGIQENLITYLSNFPDELKVRQTETVNSLIPGKNLTTYATITPSIAKTISLKLGANVCIYGSMQQAGTKLRLNAKLIETKTEEVLKSYEIDAPYKEEIIFKIIDSLRRGVADFLLISEIKKELIPGIMYSTNTNSPEAYRYYANGFKSFSRWEYSSARDWFLKAIAADSNFIEAYLGLSDAYSFLGMAEQAKNWCLRAYNEKNMMPVGLQIWTNYTYSSLFDTPYEELKYLKQLQEMDDKMDLGPLIGFAYHKLGLHDKALTEFEKNLEYINKTARNPEFERWALDYALLGEEYHFAGQYRKEKKVYKEAEKYFPYDPQIIYLQAILALAQNDLKIANHYIEKYKSSLKEKSLSETEILTSVADIYSKGNSLDQAEEYYRQALSLKPDSTDIMNYLAFFLIDKDRNINEGMDLIEKALSLNHANYNYLYTKGCGLFKQGKYKESLEILQKSWDLRREKDVYDHDPYLHLEAAKKAVANQK